MSLQRLLSGLHRSADAPAAVRFAHAAAALAISRSTGNRFASAAEIQARLARP
ncbi:MAG: hypothetical protein HC915_06605 [Anaerolineae bacterium]|nr:hypothetical protein [Anaerolineae bacterium]